MTDAYPIPDEVLVHHAAFLGKTRSGKTSSAKTAVERFVAAGERVCVLDPIKSDWWGLISSADGKAPGLPFQILGGPHGHVPLPSSSGKVIGELVATGALPLSIVDMADFAAGGLQQFFCAFAEALMRHQRGVLHLVIEEAHEFAPKERAGIGDENMAIHWAKKLATAGGSKGIRLIVATQRTQALHNAILGSCETLVAHRLTAPADQKPVIDWLKANVEKDLAAEIGGSLASLKTGSAWVCSGEAQLFRRVDFPRIATFDNSATPLTDDQAQRVQTAAVDVGALRQLVGDAVAEAEANDPRRLKAEIARLKGDLAKRGGAVPAAPDRALTKAAEDAAFLRGVEEGERRGQVAGQALMLTRARNALDGLRVDEAPQGQPVPQTAPRPIPTPPRPQREPLVAPAQRQRGEAPALAPLESRETPALTGPMRRILNAVAWWTASGIAEPSTEQVAFAAGYSNATGGGFANPRSALSAAGLIQYPRPGHMRLSDAGAAAAEAPTEALTTEVLHARVMDRLNGPQQRILRPLLDVYPDALETPQLAELAGYTNHTGGGFANPRSSLSSISLITYPAPGQVRASDWLFP